MTRVATFGNYQSALLQLMNAQSRGEEAQTRVSTGKNATSLTGFGRGSETITALKSSEVRIQSYIDISKTVANRLETQDLGLDRVADAATSARRAIADAIAAGRTEGLMGEMESLFQSAQNGLNTKHQGRYLFAGGTIETQPSQIDNLADLATKADVGEAFHNDQVKQTSWLDETINMETGFLASDIGQALYKVFQDIQIFHQNTPFSGSMTEDQRIFLSSKMAEFEQTATGIVNLQASNGAKQARVDDHIQSQESRKISVETILSGKTDANLAEALTELEMAQIAIQASAQVISQLRQVSLLDYLR